MLDNYTKNNTAEKFLNGFMLKKSSETYNDDGSINWMYVKLNYLEFLEINSDGLMREEDELLFERIKLKYDRI